MNSLLAPWTGPYGGVPDFGRARLEDLLPAFDAAAEEHLAELDAIAACADPPTFENTVAAMERTGRAMWRVMVHYGTWASALSSPEFLELDPVVSWRRAEYLSAIGRKRALYERVCAVHEAGGLPPVEARLVDLVRKQLLRSGAALDAAGQARYAEIERRLAGLYAAFRKNMLADEETWLELTEAELAGLPKSFRDAARGEARERGLDGWVVLNTRSSVEPVLLHGTDRAVRERVWRAFTSRGDHGDERDNNGIIVEVLKLRRERARLLGSDDFVQWVLEDRMAGTPDQVRALLAAVWPAARDAVKAEVAAMQAIADRDGVVIEPWDYALYAAKLRAEQQAFDAAELSAHLQLDRLVQGMFDAAGALYGLAFDEVDDVPVYHPDVRVWEVTRGGGHVGLFYFDPYARPGKRSGAWARSLRLHETFDEKRTTITTNTCNFVKPPAGEPALLSWTEATTLFHEFGHGLHALLSESSYPGLAGAVRDFVELQSQLMERWLSTDRVLERWARRFDTDTPLPRTLVEQVRAAARASEAFDTTEYLASAFLDLELHVRDPEGLDVRAVEREVLDELGMPKELVARHRPTHFAHVFASEGYAVGYYGYLWADVLSADAAEAFAEAPGGFYDEATAEAARKWLYAPQDTIEPGEAYRVTARPTPGSAPSPVTSS